MRRSARFLISRKSEPYGAGFTVAGLNCVVRWPSPTDRERLRYLGVEVESGGVIRSYDLQVGQSRTCEVGA